MTRRQEMPPADPDAPLLTPEEVAERTRLCVATIRRLCARGQIRATKLAGQWRIAEGAYIDWIASGQPEPGVMRPGERRRIGLPASRWHLRASTTEAMQMSIERTPDGGHKVRWWTADGRHRSRKFNKGEKRLAEAFEDEVKQAKRLGRLGRLEAELEGGQKPLGAVYTEWWQAHGPTLRPKTETLYRWLSNSLILPYLGDQPIGAITTREIEWWLAELDTGTVAKRKAAALLSQVYNAARRWGYVHENPVEVAKRPKAPPRKAVRPPTPEDVERARKAFLDADRPGDAYLLSVLYIAGLRPEETRALRWTDWRSRTLLVDAPKTGRSRAVDVCAPLARDLATWRLATGGSGLVFPNTRGEPISESGWSNWRRRVWYGTEKRPGPGRAIGKPYLLRHTCASLLVREGRSVTEVAEQMGHSPEECLRTYAHVFQDFDPTDRADRETLIRRARGEVFGTEASGEAAGG